MQTCPLFLWVLLPHLNNTFDVDTIVDMMLRSHCNHMSWCHSNYIITIDILSILNWWKNLIDVGTTYINKSSNWWLYVEDSMLISSLIPYVHGIITIYIELTLGLFWHNLHFFHTHSMDKIFLMLKQHELITYWLGNSLHECGFSISLHIA